LRYQTKKNQLRTTLIETKKMTNEWTCDDCPNVPMLALRDAGYICLNCGIVAQGPLSTTEAQEQTLDALDN
jgi:hypothetical protein